MSDQKKYDLDFRPNSYWGPQDVETVIGARVKGELRRQQAMDDLEVGHADSDIISESLTEEHRRAVGAVHPHFMGGEYLPNLYSNEVEIARIVMQSTTMDVISIRARETKNRIVYRIVDEYESEFWDYYLTKKSSVKPLTMRELISLIDNGKENGLVGNGRNWHYEEGSPAEEIYNFETASSAYYTELADWYDEVNEEWLVERQKEEKQVEVEDEYEDRYFQGETDVTPEENEWRYVHKERLERENKIRVHLAKCEWERHTGKLAGFGNEQRYRRIRSFVEEYLESNNSLPTGTHLIDDVEVKFDN